MTEGDSNDKTPSGKIEKEEMVSILTSTGRIRSSLAESIHDQGLEDIGSLVKGDEDYFLGFKGVGKKTAEALLEIAVIEKEKMEKSSKAPDIREILSEVPRITETVISTIMEKGYTDLSRFKDATAEDLMELKGVGPKLSVSIIDVVNEAIELYGAEPGEPIIEDATAVVPDEEEQEVSEEEEKQGFLDKVLNGIRSLFSGKKKEAVEEEPAEQEKEEEEASGEVEEKPAEGEEKEEAEEEPVEEEPAEKTEEETPDEEEKVEEPAEKEGEEEEKEEEEPAQEEKVEGEEEPVEEEPAEKTEEETPEEEEKVEEAPKPGILDKIMGFFKGSKKEEPAEEEKAEEEEEPSEGTEKEEDREEDETSGEGGEEETEEKEEIIEAGPMISEIEDVPGISKGIASKLKEAGYMNLDELKEAVPEDLVMIEGIGEKTAAKICEALKDL